MERHVTFPLQMDSFVKKFKILCQAGRNASLTLSSNAGKAVLNLRVDLGVLEEQDPHPPHHPSTRSRNGPSQQRRRDRRAAARKATSEQAEAVLSLEERQVLREAEKAEANHDAEKAEANVNAVKANIVTEVKVTEEVKENAVDKVQKDTEKVVHNGPEGEADLVVDEFCSNESYNLDKTNSATSQSAPRPSRGLGSFDYYSLKFEDFYEDPD